MDPFKDAVTKAACEKSLLWFTRYMFHARTGKRFIVSPHHVAMCDHLEMVARGTLPDGARNLIINVPPRYGKTEILNNFQAWGFILNAGCNFIDLSYSDKLALDNSAQVRAILKHPKFQRFWPVQTLDDVDAKGLWRIDGGGGVLASAAGGAITGFGAGSVYPGPFSGSINIDDPLKPDDARYENIRMHINERLPETIMSRRNGADTPIILIMQRLHEMDMTGYILAGNTGEKWHHLVLPALQEDGTALWPHKHSVERLLEMRAANRRIFAGQYQQKPTPEEGLFVKASWLQKGQRPAWLKRVVVAVDPAVTSEKNSDETGIIVCGIDDKGFGYVLADLSGILTPHQWATRAVNAYNHFEADLIVAEVNNGGDLVETNIRAVDKNVHIKKVRASRGKAVRLEPVAGLYERGLIIHCGEFEEYEHQLLTYDPQKSSKSPDRLDAGVWGFTELMLSGNVGGIAKIVGV